MDPDACLNAIRRVVARIVNDGAVCATADTERLAELVDALDEWITRGGFLPSAWNPDHRRMK